MFIEYFTDQFGRGLVYISEFGWTYNGQDLPSDCTFMVPPDTWDID